MNSRQQRRHADRKRAKTAQKGVPVGLAAGVIGVVALVAVAVVLFSSGSGDTANDPPVASASPDVGESDAVPNVTLSDFDGNPVHLADYVGRPLVINFWASWCVPCLAEMPGFEQVYQRQRPAVQFLGINLQDDPGAAQAVIRQTGISYPVARDIDGSAFVAFRALGMPTTIFVSAEGEVLSLHTGGLFADDLEEQIISLFEL